ncbi:O-antigen ligase family protein [Candidatus Nomurabacteria bacterium]|nr:O-antigen ligase family protein [Candidatus Nomurabacteria bacterium]
MLEILAIFLAFCFGALAYHNLLKALALLIFLLPSYLWRLSFFGLPSSFLELLILALFLIFLIKDQNWRKFNFFQAKENLLSKKWQALLFLWLLASLFALFVNFNFSSLGLWRAYFLEPMMVFLVFIYAINKEKDLKLIYLSFSALLFSLFAIALFQALTAWNLPAAYDFPNPRRLTTLFSYPNALALFVAPLAIFLLSLAKIVQNQKERIIYFISAIMGFLLLIFARSEGAILALVIALFIFIFKKLRKNLERAIIFAASAFVLFFTPLKVYFYKIFGDLLWPNSEYFTSSLAVRGLQWQETFALLHDHWFFGAGINGYQKMMAIYHQITWLEIFLYPHNIFLNFWVELGLFGLLIFIGLLFFIFKTCWQLIKNQNILAWPLTLAWLTILIHGLVDVPYFKNDLSVLFFIFLALLIIAQKQGKAQG